MAHLLKSAFSICAAAWFLWGCSGEPTQTMRFAAAVTNGSVHPIWVLRMDGTYEVNPVLNGEVSVEVLRVEAEQGLAAAQRDLALGYLKGQLGLQTNAAEGLKWAEMAARQGDSIAEQVMGALYNYGNFVQQDVAQSALWYRKAAEHGNPVGQVELAGMLQRGRGTQSDPAEGLRWLKCAATQGWPEGERLLGRAYWEGIGTPRNYALGYWWVRKAVKHGSSDSEVQTAMRWIDMVLLCGLTVIMVIGFGVMRWIFRGASASSSRNQTSAGTKNKAAPLPGDPVIVACPGCGQKLRVRSEQRQAMLRCRSCQSEFQTSA